MLLSIFVLDKDSAVVVKQEVKEEKEGEASETKEEKPVPVKTNPNSNNRILKGVMRVGPLCTGLLLKGQLAVDLVVLCAGK